jgi:RimJ/RimL family protein N-acetyltransferase
VPPPRSLAEDQFIVGAFEDGRLSGVVGFHRETRRKTRHKGHIWGVYVRPEKRRQGLARKMLQTVLQRVAGIHGLEQVLVSVAVTQTAACHLYQSLGFESWGLEPRALGVGDQSGRRTLFDSAPEVKGEWLSPKEKAPRPFSPGRLGSPPPELPNYELDTRDGQYCCKHHFGNGISAKLKADPPSA